MALAEIFELFQYVNIQSAVLFVIVFTLYLRLFKKEDLSNLPPGPKGWPFLGNLLSLSLHSEHEMSEWNKQYGSVCRLKMAGRDFIILGSLDAVEEAFVKKKDWFSDRMQDSIPGLPGDGGILFKNYGAALREQRRFGLATLRLFGMGRKSIEPRIIQECSDMCEKISHLSEIGKPFSVNFLIYQAISTVISQLVFNKNLPKENKEFRDYLHLVMTGSKYSPINALTVFCPSLKPFPPFRWGMQEAERESATLQRLIDNQIDDHKESRDPQNPRDLIDCFLNEMDSYEKPQSDFTENQLSKMVRDLFLAGSETTSSTICWAVLYLSLHQDLQNELHHEIEEVLGQARQPSVAVADKMPFTKAVVQETLRIRPVAPLGVPHVVNKEGSIMGYRIPKGAIVASNLYRILHDENVWSDPESFRPSRHLDSDGKLVKHPSLIPFSVGARQCLGMQLANMELFLIMVSLFQKFSFEVPGVERMDMRGSNIFTLRPYPFDVIVKKR